jgi:pimeloyl-ACP methyl ester carboxylesterase
MEPDQFVDVCGATICVHCEGKATGTPIVLVHGIALTHDMWKFQIPYLVKRDYYVVAPDLRGFGQSQPCNPEDPANYTYKRWADDLRIVINKLNLQHMTLVGYSMGGAVVMRYMSDPHPPVDKLILVAATGPNMRAHLPFPDDYRLYATCEGLKEFAELITRYGKYLVFDKFMRFAFPLIDFPNSTGKNNLVQWIEEMYNEAADQALINGCFEMQRDHKDLTQGVGAISTPTKICHGKIDLFVPFKLGEYQQSLIRGADLMPFDVSGHGLFCEMQRDLLSEQLAW